MTFTKRNPAGGNGGARKSVRLDGSNSLPNSANSLDRQGSNRLPVLAAEIRRAHAGVEDAAKTAAERAIEAGQALVEAKALLKHGEWLPWLQEHCALSERVAQLYMRIAGSGLKSETVSLLGLKAAAKAITFQLPDPFADVPPAVMRDWWLHLLQGVLAGYDAEAIAHYGEWLKRNGWDSPDEWFGAEGDEYRARRGFRRIPKRVKSDWRKFQREHADKDIPAIKAAIDAAAAGAP